ncbi:pyroglutamyl-peptidase 1-like isoform X2 [Anneissia japonica]|uniref:pyroglutamyl-peptidase 1-like isoform X2 n=1 Tax=Anneissia japonica TaxID=1529436 RepID=UPI001425667B|nr:pyroglutamyl-peptidase 1-like isoform X2 [Anneissia japonica]
MPDKKTVIVTGFGPFGDHKINASWEAVKELTTLSLQPDINLVVEEIPVEYKIVKEKVPALWECHEPDLMVHVGVSGLATELTLEQQAHNGPYDKPDVRFMIPRNMCCMENGPQHIESRIKMAYVCHNINISQCPVKSVVSHNPGRYLCDFIYYTSLHHIHAKSGQGNAAFIHVPPLGRPYTAKQLAEGLKLAILNMLQQSDSASEDIPECNSWQSIAT